MAAFPVISERPVYTLTKLTAAHFFELTAQHVSPEKMQVINFHPGQIWSQAWERAGMEFPRDLFDDGKSIRNLILRILYLSSSLSMFPSF